MIKLAIAVFIGLMFGWFLVPQPKWAQPLWSKGSNIINGLINKFRKKPEDVVEKEVVVDKDIVEKDEDVVDKDIDKEVFEKVVEKVDVDKKI